MIKIIYKPTKNKSLLLDGKTPKVGAVLEVPIENAHSYIKQGLCRPSDNDVYLKECYKKGLMKEPKKEEPEPTKPPKK